MASVEQTALVRVTCNLQATFSSPISSAEIQAFVRIVMSKIYFAYG